MAKSKYEVQISADAEADLLEIYQYIESNDGEKRAGHVLEKLEATCLKLERFPLRAHIPVELKRLKISDYREILWKPYRLLYQIESDKVFMLAILDGRRHLQDLLMQRLLR